MLSQIIKIKDLHQYEPFTELNLEVHIHELLNPEQWEKIKDRSLNVSFQLYTFSSALSAMVWIWSVLQGFICWRLGPQFESSEGV